MALSSESNTASSAQTPSNLAIALGVARGRLFASFAGHLYVVDHTAIVRLWDVGRDPDAGRVSGAVGGRWEVGERALFADLVGMPWSHDSHLLSCPTSRRQPFLFIDFAHVRLRIGAAMTSAIVPDSGGGGGDGGGGADAGDTGGGERSQGNDGTPPVSAYEQALLAEQEAALERLRAMMVDNLPDHVDVGKTDGTDGGIYFLWVSFFFDPPWLCDWRD